MTHGRIWRRGPALGLTLTAALACASALACAPAEPASPVARAGQPAALPPAERRGAPAAPALREGILLDHVVSPRLHAVEGGLFVSAGGENEGQGRLLYRVRGDELVPQPAHQLPAGAVSEGLELVGRLPDRVFAVAHGRDADSFKTRVLRRKDDGWTELPLAETLFQAVWWSDRLVGLVRDPAIPLGQRLVRLDAPGAEITIPKGEGAACDAFYAPGRTSFPKLAVQPRGIASAGQQLFLLGMGCDGQFAAAAWAKGSAVPTIQAIAEPTFFDGFPGTVIGRGATDLWYFRRPMRPMTLAALWHSDGARWSKVPWPTEDPQVESVDVDESGTLWAVIDGKLHRRAGDRWDERPLPAACEARSVAATEKRSLWVACGDAVARISR